MDKLFITYIHAALYCYAHFLLYFCKGSSCVMMSHMTLLYITDGPSLIILSLCLFVILFTFYLLYCVSLSLYRLFNAYIHSFNYLYIVYFSLLNQGMTWDFTTDWTLLDVTDDCVCVGFVIGDGGGSGGDCVVLTQYNMYFLLVFKKIDR